jgi:tRNA (guanine37-N1)-methyltransferase
MLEKKRLGLKEALSRDERFSEQELKILPRSFDVLGEIALIQIPRELEEKEKIIGEMLLELNKHVKTVYGKGKFYGRLRKQKIRLIAGKNQEETIYKESGCLMKLNIKTCYFSPRLSTDRLDVAKKVKKKENVLVMFSGVAPYGLVIAKHSKCKKVVNVELNRECTKYAKINIRLNRLSNCEAVQGDVKKICPEFKKKKIYFDRIVMARPQLKDTFLKEAFLAAKKGTIIHFQDFVNQKEIDKDISRKRVLEAAKSSRKKVRISDFKILRELAPYKYHVRVDFRLL